MPIVLWNSSWEEIIGILYGKYAQDTDKALEVIQKYGIKSDYRAFFENKYVTLVGLSIAIFVAILIICLIIKKAVNKKKIKTNE